MIYPKRIKASNRDKILYSLLLASLIIAILLVVINKLTSPKFPWAGIANCGIIYAWITVIYSMDRNTNIAGHVLVQVIAISLITLYIDYRLGFKGWSIDIAIPIIIIIANVIMFVLTIVSHKKYIKYAIYQLIIVFFSMLPCIFIAKHLAHNIVLSIVASAISALNFIVTLCLCAGDVKEAIVRKFHI